MVMNNDVLSYIDFDRVNNVLDGFHNTMGYAFAVVDLNGNVLSNGGWKPPVIDLNCIDPLRKLPIEERCNQILPSKSPNTTFHFYKCVNGLFEVVAPIVVNNVHIANIVSGLFLLKESEADDESQLYRSLCGEILSHGVIPVVTKEMLVKVLDLLVDVLHLVVELAIQKHEQIELNKELLNSEQKFKSVFESASVGKSITLPTGEIFANQVLCSMLGYTPATLNGKKWHEITYTDDIPHSISVTDDLLNGKYQSARLEKRLIRNDGAILWVDVSVSMVLDLDGSPMHFVTNIIDISERKQIEFLLNEKLELITEMGKMAKIGGWEFDAVTGKGTWTEETARIHDLDPDDETSMLQGLSFYKDESRKIIEEAIKNILETGEPYNLELELVTAKGVEKWVHTIGHAIIENGKVIKVRGSFQDITQRKRMESNLRESEEKFRLLFQEHSAVKLIINPLNGDIVEANNAAAQFYGWTVDELLNMKISSISMLEAEQVNRDMAMVMQNGSHQFESKHRRSDGKVVDVEVFSGKVLLGGEVFFHSIIHDISDKIRIREEMTLLKKAVEAANVSINITDSLGNLVYVNPFFEKLTGYKSNDVIGRNPRFLKSGYHSRQFYEQFWQTLLSGNVWEGEILNRKSNSELYWVKAHILPIRNEKGETVNYVSIKEDITEKKSIHHQLVIAKEKAEESDRLKTAFLNNISHELRTPLNGILGFGHFLADPSLSTEKRRLYYDFVKSSSERLLNTVTDYIDMAMLVSGSMAINKQAVDVNAMINELSKWAESLSNTKGLNFKASTSGNAKDCQLYTDAELLKKTLQIVIQNAVKFTNRGSVLLECSLSHNAVDFFIKDTGVGIEKSKQEFIFEMFTQEDISNTRTHEGSGLGLAIARGLVNLLDGKIMVESEKGQGSMFIVSIPIEKMDKVEDIALNCAVASPNNSDALVLVAEDDELNFCYIESLLELMGYNYLHARDGLEAVNYCKQNSAIACVLMDIKMPVMDGIQAAKAIREFRHDLPIIATTAFAQTGDAERFLNAGFDEYISKPIAKEKLMSILESLIAKTSKR